MKSLVVPATLAVLLLAPLCITSLSFAQLAETEFVRGDMDGDGMLGLDDCIFVLDYLFQDGPTPPCLAACDADGNDSFDGLGDVLYLLDAVFLAEEPPPAPYPDCGPDEDTVLMLGCNTPSCP